MPLVAIRYRVNFSGGGIRPPGIADKKDRRLLGHPSWQNVESGIEMRLIIDGEKKPYLGIDGVQILEGTAIDEAAQGLRQPKYITYNPSLCAASIASQAIKTAPMKADWTPSQEAEYLYKQGASGIKFSDPEPITAAELHKKGLV